jgi:hypothetical protein
VPKLLRSIMPKLFNCTNIDIFEKFPRLADLGCGAFGEDADTFGDTLREVIESDPETRDLPFKRQTIDELKIFLTYSDRDIERISRIVLGINPTVDPEEPHDWGSFPSLRAFWSAVQHAFENDPEVQAGENLARTDTGGYLSPWPMDDEAPPCNRKPGGYVLRNHVNLTDAYIEQRFVKEKRFSVSFFTSKEEAENAIHRVLRDNTDKIDDWLENAGTGAKIDLEGHISGKGAIVIESANRQRKAARRLRVTIVRDEYNGMIYYIHTVKLYP